MGKCQRHNHPTKEKTTTEGHQWFFNAARNSSRMRASADPKQKWKLVQ